MNPILQKAVSFLYGAIRFIPGLGTMLGPTAVEGIDIMEAVQPSLAALMVTPEWAAFVGALSKALSAPKVRATTPTTTTRVPGPYGVPIAKPTVYEAPPAIFPWDHR